jgi:hypothetical protein
MALVRSTTIDSKTQASKILTHKEVPSPSDDEANVMCTTIFLKIANDLGYFFSDTLETYIII